MDKHSSQQLPSALVLLLDGILQPHGLMMMAYDSGQTPLSRLEPETLDALRASLREHLMAGSSPALQACLLAMATEAREKSIPAEQVLIALKDVWAKLPEVRAMTDPKEQVRLLQRVVTMCIKEYYSA